jgi:hypothetical protein
MIKRHSLVPSTAPPKLVDYTRGLGYNMKICIQKPAYFSNRAFFSENHKIIFWVQ